MTPLVSWIHKSLFAWIHLVSDARVHLGFLLQNSKTLKKPLSQTKLLLLADENVKCLRGSLKDGSSCSMKTFLFSQYFHTN